LSLAAQNPAGQSSTAQSAAAQAAAGQSAAGQVGTGAGQSAASQSGIGAGQSGGAQTPDSTRNTDAGSVDKMTKPEKMSSGKHSKDAGSSGASATDTKFAHEAAIGSLMEVEMGKVALEKASNEKVKQFGQRMIDDHTKASDQLKTVAAKKSITLPTELDAKSKGMMDKMSAMSGAAFDKAYMKDMVNDHKKDISEFQKEASNGSDTDLKGFASQTLPILQEHLRLAQETAAAVNGKQTSSSSTSSSSSSSSTGSAGSNSTPTKQ